MTKTVRIVFCQCVHAGIVPEDVKREVQRGLASAGVQFESVPDLCVMAARQDPVLKQWAGEGELRVVACYPRAVRWLFAAGDAPLVGDDARVFNMRTEGAEGILGQLLGQMPSANAAEHVDAVGQEKTASGGWDGWFPVIDFGRCTNCMQCLSFCLFDVYGVSPEGTIRVQKPANCKTGCPACSRVCPEVAILFPKYGSSPINGDEVNGQDVRREAMKVDISALLGGDVYAAVKDRNGRARARFSKERDEDRALAERRHWLESLQQQLDIPPEVLAALPSAEEIRARAQQARARAQDAGNRRQNSME